ncbi:MAG: SOUL family heme-binding protein [Methanomassiliicoccales archaeon]
MVEKLAYKVREKVDDVELRRYGETYLATVEGLSDQEAFRALFRYISGRNGQGREITMTSPVISFGEGIPMVSPVLPTGNGMSFIIPSDYSWEEIPRPTESGIRIERLPERTMAVLGFRGRVEGENVGKMKEKLLRTLRSEGIRARGEVILMRYGPPYMPGVLRRNEVAVQVV